MAEETPSVLFAADNPAGAWRDGTPPAHVREALMPAVPALVESAVQTICSQRSLPGLSREGLERNLRLGLLDAARRWFEPQAAAESNDLHASLGRAQVRAGRSLDELMGIYRTAGQSMWRGMTEVGVAAGVAPADLYRLAETGLGCVDEVSTRAAAGFAEEQSQRSGASHSRRSELVRLLLRDPQPAVEALESAAARAGMEIAPTLALFVGPGEHYDEFARLAGDEAIIGPREGEFVGALLDPDGEGRRERLSAAAERAGVALALGPAVELARARESLATARALLSLMLAGLIAAPGVVVADEHDVELLLSCNPRMAGELARRRLAPLQSVSGEATRANLSLTLREWLRHPGQRKAIADALGVHPQTIRYRMARLRELFGEDLDDPDRRFELELALRVAPYAQLATEGSSPVPSRT